MCWSVSVSVCVYIYGYVQAIYHAPIKKERGLRNHAFGVAGVHMRFDAFVRLFRRATTLRDTLKFGCGDMGTSGLFLCVDSIPVAVENVCIWVSFA